MSCPCGKPIEHERYRARGWACPHCIAGNYAASCKSDPQPVLERLEEQLTAMDKRMVRIETRATNALRYLGLRPGEPVPDAGKGSVAMVDGILMVTGMDVAVRDIALAAVLSNEKGDIPIFVNNHQWGVIHVR